MKRTPTLIRHYKFRSLKEKDNDDDPLKRYYSLLSQGIDLRSRPAKKRAKKINKKVEKPFLITEDRVVEHPPDENGDVTFDVETVGDLVDLGDTNVGHLLRSEDAYEQHVDELEEQLFGEQPRPFFQPVNRLHNAIGTLTDKIDDMLDKTSETTPVEDSIVTPIGVDWQDVYRELNKDEHKPVPMIKVEPAKTGKKDTKVDPKNTLPEQSQLQLYGSNKEPTRVSGDQHYVPTSKSDKPGVTSGNPEQMQVTTYNQPKVVPPPVQEKRYTPTSTAEKPGFTRDNPQLFNPASSVNQFSALEESFIPTVGYDVEEMGENLVDFKFDPKSRIISDIPGFIFKVKKAISNIDPSKYELEDPTSVVRLNMIRCFAQELSDKAVAKDDRYSFDGDEDVLRDYKRIAEKLYRLQHPILRTYKALIDVHLGKAPPNVIPDADARTHSQMAKEFQRIFFPKQLNVKK